MSRERTTRVSSEVRRYRVLGVLGQGGFGKVYLARLESSQGFVKEVALKVLREKRQTLDVVARLRDEARILARLRDRNVVWVDPPVQLQGRWTVVMEYAEGCDSLRLLTMHGSVPPRVALEIVGEVARTLDNLWNHPDEHGQPLHLLHRDLKPANIQISPTGGVKVLDFGVARARIAREINTSEHLSGTIGYMAPERVEGVEDHKGDVYSLGVVLEELVMGMHPTREIPEPPPHLSSVVELARWMRTREPESRPSAAEAEEQCAALAPLLPGPSLREWARTHVMVEIDTHDPLVGKVLTEDTPELTRQLHRERTTSAAWAALAGLSVGVAVLVALLALLSNPLPPFRPTAQPAESPPGSASSAQVPPPPVRRVKERAPPAPLVQSANAEDAPDAKAAGPEEEAPVPDPTGIVRVTGNADRVVLESHRGRFRPGELPAGKYEVVATFAGREVRAATVMVRPGRTVRIHCDRRFKNCKP